MQSTVSKSILTLLAIASSMMILCLGALGLEDWFIRSLFQSLELPLRALLFR